MPKFVIEFPIVLIPRFIENLSVNPCQSASFVIYTINSFLYDVHSYILATLVII